MMATPEVESGLEERLGRLKGQPTTSCAPEYEEIAEKVRASSKFSAALARFKALSDENRLLAVSLLKRRKELCACEIQAATGLTHATVSHHMRLLVETGLVTARREGKWMYYRFERDAEVNVP